MAMQFNNLFDSPMPMFNIILPLFSRKPSDVDVILSNQVIQGPHSKSYMPMHIPNQKMFMYYEQSISSAFYLHTSTYLPQLPQMWNKLNSTPVSRPKRTFETYVPKNICWKNNGCTLWSSTQRTYDISDFRSSVNTIRKIKSSCL